jgi:Tfp pilus assembly protein PilX
MRPQSDYIQGSVAGREALGMTLSNLNEVTGRTEIVIVYTSMLRNGNLFYMISVAPQNEYNNYEAVFQNVLRSIQLND